MHRGLAVEHMTVADHGGVRNSVRLIVVDGLTLFRFDERMQITRPRH